MNNKSKQIINIAILDLNDGQENYGISSIQAIIDSQMSELGVEYICDTFGVRCKCEVPDMSYDIFISSGGPGSPLESVDSEWEKRYFEWLTEVEKWNADEKNTDKKYVFFICHSFQLACRYYSVGNICERQNTAFGIFPIHLLEEAKKISFFGTLADPLYVVENRKYQVLDNSQSQKSKSGPQVLAFESDLLSEHVDKKALAIVSFNTYMIGTQFHPEIDSKIIGIQLYQEDKKKLVVDSFGDDLWQTMVHSVDAPNSVSAIHNTVLPTFLKQATLL